MPPIIKVSNLHKSFRLPHDKQSSLKGGLISLFRGGKRKFEHQQVLKDVSFEIKKGEFFGIVGRNGSGKSTLLKLLAGIYAPEKGSIEIGGTLTPFIELGVGFNPELTGRENVFLNGALLGFNREEMSAMYDDIVEFAELERFMDQKLKNYSSGMQVRLAFSIAIRAQSDILLLDEVLAVGDSAFQQKCYEYFAQLKKEKKTVILVSHSMSSVERFCDSALLLDMGEVKRIGSSRSVATAYQQLFIDDANRKTSKDMQYKTKGNKAELKIEARISQGGVSKKAIRAQEKFDIEITVESKIKIKKMNVGINIRNVDGDIVFSDNTRRTNSLISLDKGGVAKVTVSLENYYTDGKYIADIIVADEAGIGDRVLKIIEAAATFSVIGVTEHVHSLFHPPHSINLTKQHDS